MSQVVREHGAILVDGLQAATTLRCPHCGGHFVYAKGKLEEGKKLLGNAALPKVYCRKCDRLTCGRPCCDPDVVGCIPLEARLEFREGSDSRIVKYDDPILELQARGLPLL
jgi:hypothetical protein